MLAVGVLRRKTKRKARPLPHALDGVTPLVTVLIANFNYGRFLRYAIDSALGQTYPRLEVIVVDDGSTDDSRDIIASYGNRIISVFKENGGHGSAVNAGFAVSHGEVICLLDSDDRFLPDKVSRVVRAWLEDPQSAVIYHPLQAVDTSNASIGRAWPRAVWRGNIRHRVERSGGWWPYPTTSGLCFTRSYLERMLPMPTVPRTTYPDTYLAGPAAFVGPVCGLAPALTHSTFHDFNDSNWGRVTAEDDAEGVRIKFRRRQAQSVAEFHMLKHCLSERLGVYADISLADYFPYHRYSRAVGEGVSLPRLIWMALRCPALPPPLKLVEAINIFLDRW